METQQGYLDRGSDEGEKLIETTLRTREEAKLLLWAQEAEVECIETLKNSHEDYCVLRR